MRERGAASLQSWVAGGPLRLGEQAGNPGPRTR